MEKQFRQDNTEGYTDDQLEELNFELEGRIADTIDGAGAQPDSEELEFLIKNFSDEVSRR